MYKLDERQLEAELQELLTLGSRMESELILRIAKRFKYGDPTGGTLQWYLRKLAEMGAFTAGNRKIIAEYSETIQTELDKKLEDLGYGSLMEIERDYEKGYILGTLTTKPPNMYMSSSLKSVWVGSLKQAHDKLNLVNTIAAESADRAYLDITNKCYMSVSTGLYDYNTALRQAMLEFADRGITGATYQRKDGSLIHYPLDAALRRNVMSTSSRLINDMQEIRAQEWGCDPVEVSSHIGARPLCAPYQGRIYSLSGNHPKYPPLSSTSMGQPAGLFGINCHHIKYPFIEGVSERTYYPYPDAKNRKVYEESQRQRELEVSVRKYKQRVMIADGYGDKKLFDSESVKLKAAERDLKDFKQKTGRTQQSRTRVTGFNRSVSQKAVWANKKAIYADGH